MLMTLYLQGLLAMLVLGVATWLLSLYKRDVSIVDSIWSLMFLAAALVYVYQNPQVTLFNWLVFLLVTLWALRLAIHLTWRNWGEEEDRRYQQIRKKYSPHFGFKSLFIIFVFQAVLASIAALPLLPALVIPVSPGILSVFGVLLWIIGMSFEVVGDYQLARFKADPDNKGEVLASGLLILQLLKMMDVNGGQKKVTHQVIPQDGVMDRLVHACYLLNSIKLLQTIFI